MKDKSKIFNYIAIIILFAIVTSCGKLDFQDKFEFKPDIPELTPYKDLTAWEFLELDPKKEFTYMKQAIELAGLKDEYINNSTKYTFLLLKNEAFTASGQALQALTGRSNGDLATVPKERLIKFVKYNILEKYVDQGPEHLVIVNRDYIFQSLVPGDEGKVSIRRNVFLSFAFNLSPLLPVTKKGTNQVTHNYVFKNGIAHFLNTQYIRAVPF